MIVCGVRSLKGQEKRPRRVTESPAWSFSPLRGERRRRDLSHASDILPHTHTLPADYLTHHNEK